MKEFTEEETKVLAVKYSGQRIYQLNQIEFDAAIPAILLRINTITGWRVSTDADTVEVLQDEFKLYLNENQSDMTIDEILYAIRNYSLDIQDWGKSMNLSLINQPLSRYRARRAELSDLEERIKKQSREPQKVIEAPKEVDWSPLWSDIFIAAQEGKIATKIIPVTIYDWLIQKNKLILSVDQRKEYYQRAKDIYKTDLLTRASLDQLSLDEKNHLHYVKNDTELTNEATKNIIVNRAKVMAVKEFAVKESQ